LYAKSNIEVAARRWLSANGRQVEFSWLTAIGLPVAARQHFFVFYKNVFTFLTRYMIMNIYNKH
jgi:hypothetical protein